MTLSNIRQVCAVDIARRFAPEERLTLRERYRATIRKTTVTVLATGKVDETHELVGIEPL